jgi:hypothetical protein
MSTMINNSNTMTGKKTQKNHKTKNRPNKVLHTAKYNSTAKHGTGSSSKGSVKSQLRGQQRLLEKLLSGTPSDEQSSEEFRKRKNSLETKIKSLELQNQKNRLKEIERRNAIKYHKVKFFERQKLTRMERRLTKTLKAELSLSPDNVARIQQLKDELSHVHQDQLYVKYYPNDTKYVSLFPDGVYYKTLETENEEVIAKRAEIRRRISELNVALAKQQLDNLDGVPTATIDHVWPRKGTKDDKIRLKKEKDATRGMAKAIEPEGSTAEQGKLSMMYQAGEKDDNLVKAPSVVNDDEDSVSISESDSVVSSSSHSTSTSSSRSSSSSSTKESLLPNISMNKNAVAFDSSEEDDFFVETEVNVNSLFHDAKSYSEGLGSVKGDKSKGWATQNQRPGQFKRRIERKRL